MRVMTFIIVALLATASAHPSYAAQAERWTAVSKTAMAITGDITLSPTQLVAAGKAMPLAVEVDVSDFRNGLGPQAARILKVTRPANPVLLHGNTLCGEPVRWIAVYRSNGGKGLNLAAFSTSERPTGEAGACATFFYER